jgi:peptide/nickel transport system permease protein
MLRFVAHRLMQAVVVMLCMSLLVFIGVYAVGNPVDVLIGPDATQEMRAQLIARYGFDQPLYQQYFAFLWRVLHGDLGTSMVFNRPVTGLILSRLPATLELTLLAVGGAAIIGIPLGMFAGYKPHNPVSRLAMAISIVGFSVPTFWVGLVLIFTFSVSLGWLPAGSRGDTIDVLGVSWSLFTLDGLKHLILPSTNLAIFNVALMMRMARAGTREVMLSDTVRFARATGQSEWTVLRNHVLKLISIPLVAVFGLEMGSTLAFAVVTETIYSWPGVGKLIIDSIFQLDRPVMLAYLILVAFVFIIINMLVDIAYVGLDPRLRSAAT